MCLRWGLIESEIGKRKEWHERKIVIKDQKRFGEKKVKVNWTASNARQFHFERIKCIGTEV